MSTEKIIRILPTVLMATSLLGSAMIASAQTLTQSTVPSKSRSYVAQAAAPVGTYTGQMSGTATTRRLLRPVAETSTSTSTTSTSTSTRHNRRTTPAAGTAASLMAVVTSFSPTSELQAISKAGSGNLSKALAAYQHGQVKINNSAYPIQVATYRTSKENYILQLVSAAPYSKASTQGTTAQGNTFSLVEITIPKAGGTGTGKYYQSVQLNISQSGEVSTIGGASAATLLTNVEKAQN